MKLSKIKKYFYKIFFLSGVNERYIKVSAVFESIVSADPKKLFIIVLAFNQPELVELHHAAIKKFIRDDYEYFVMDNSSKDEPSRAIKEYCLAHRVNYVRLPENPGIDESINPGLAFNWIYENVIDRFKPDCFGFIDSDLFPTEPVSINHYLDMGNAWGIITERKPFLFGPFRKTVWYLWLGLLFYRREYFEHKKPDFLPGERGIDAGGRVKVDPRKVLALPDVHDLHKEYIWTDVAPDTKVIRYGAFVHFTGASWSPHGVANQKKWMRDLLQRAGALPEK